MNRRNFLNALGAGSVAAFIPRQSKGFPEKPEEEAKRMADHQDAWIEVDLNRIAGNFSQIKKRVQVPIMAVVKANAYGHGIVEVSKALEKAGADWLMVGKLQEAVTLREAGVTSLILNFGPWGKQDCPEIIRRNISQSVYSEDAVLLEEAAAKQKTTASVQIDIDTGMSRTGVPVHRALGLIEKIALLPHLKIDGISTTLTEDPEFDREQLKQFLEIGRSARAKGISVGLRHAASSTGILSSSEFFLDMVRPGITLYGYYPNAQTQKDNVLKLKPALRLSARVIFLKDLAAGDSLSYHRVFTAQKSTRVATIGIGYGDGYPLQLAAKGTALVRNKRFPILNAVTSNHLMVELGNDREVQIGDEAILVDNNPGSGLTADILAEQGGVSDYKILIGLNPLLPRKYDSG
jgi:alanine racemase